MNDRRILLLLACLVLILPACASHDVPPIHESLEVDWNSGQSWDVTVQFWPERLRNPYVESDTSLQKSWHYTVQRVPEPSQSGQIHVTSSDQAIMLSVTDRYNVTRVRKLIEKIKGNYWKTSVLRSGEVNGATFFYRSVSNHLPMIWYHPGMSLPGIDGRWVQNTKRSLNYGGRVVQVHKREKTADGTVRKIVVKHPRTSTRVEFLWESGQPWWSHAVWSRRHRVIAVADGPG
ncbi:MAG: hypothetical protein ABEJ65_12690 [bacterium]